MNLSDLSTLLGFKALKINKMTAPEKGHGRFKRFTQRVNRFIESNGFDLFGSFVNN